MSVNVSSTGLLWLGLTLLTTLLVAGVIVFFSSRVRFGSIGDQLRSAKFVVDYERALQWRGIASRERGRLVSELRANLAAGAQESGMRGALTRLGSPRDLALDVAAGVRRPTWKRGFVAALVVFVTLQLPTVAALGIWVSAAEASGAARVDGTATILPGLDFSYTAGGPISVESGSGWYLTLLIPVVVFLIRSRVWRLWKGRSDVLQTYS